jgi:CRISPR-associated endonuclease/helicase Cas3
VATGKVFKDMNKTDLLWAKTSGSRVYEYHPILLHLLDVAACAWAILLREPESTRKRMSGIIGLQWDDALPCLLLLIACHDIGKICPGFQLKFDRCKEPLKKAGFNFPRCPDTTVNHAFVSQLVLEEFLLEIGWQEDMAILCADAIGCHHGIRASPSKLLGLKENRNGVDEKNWRPYWKEIFYAIKNVIKANTYPVKNSLSGPEFMLLSGLTSFADWLGSNEDYFPFGSIEDCANPSKWFNQSRDKAEKALDAIGWGKRIPLSDTFRSFADVFPECSPARTLQQVVAKVVSEVSSPCVLLVEAPMGEGKTEAAFYAHLEFQRRFGHRGMYMALPTKATGNAMFMRALSFLRSFAGNRTIDLQLLHGSAQLNDTFQKVRFGQIYGDGAGGSVQAGEWFISKKRALLSEYGVGTVDQALLTILPVRHYFVRLWGLANRVVIFDEIHAYDAYTGTLLFHLIRWLHALGSSVVLLSATLPPEFKCRLANTLDTKLPDYEAVYPRLTVFNAMGCKQIEFSSQCSRQQTLIIEHLDSSLTAIKSCIAEKITANCFIGVIVNTVQRAQELYNLFGDGVIVEVDGVIIGKRLCDGTEINLFHARYPAQERQKREDAILAIYGKVDAGRGELKDRCGSHVLIATQVAEQSLDLDFDLLITDLAPIDLVLQRAGRLWRHKRKNRPTGQPILGITGLAGDSAGSFGSPLWWNKVYQREDILIRTWEVLKKHDAIVIPDEIDMLVKEVYSGIAMPTDEETINRLEKAEVESVGEVLAQHTMAHQAIIGLPDDGSWKDTGRFYLYDDDEPGVHRTLKAQTRLGEDSVTVIPLFPYDNYNAINDTDFATAKTWCLRAISLSRKGVVMRLRGKGIPEGWRKTALLRNYYPMIFDAKGIWVEDHNVKLDKELGIVYIPKETQ